MAYDMPPTPLKTIPGCFGSVECFALLRMAAGYICIPTWAPPKFMWYPGGAQVGRLSRIRVPFGVIWGPTSIQKRCLK